jgi:hypothetical protein
VGRSRSWEALLLSAGSAREQGRLRKEAFARLVKDRAGIASLVLLVRESEQLEDQSAKALSFQKVFMMASLSGWLAKVTTRPKAASSVTCY